MAKIQHDLAWKWYFSSSGSGMSDSKGSRIIPYYLLENRVVKHPDPFEKEFDMSGWISHVIMEVGPHLDLATFTPLKVFLWSRLLSRGVDVCACSVLDSEVCENIDIYNKQVHAKKKQKNIWFI